MSIRWFASLYSQNYQQLGKKSPIQASHDSVQAMLTRMLYVHMSVYVSLCICACMAQCLHASMIIHACISVCLSACLSVCLYLLTPPFVQAMCVCMHVSMYAGM